MIQISLLYWIGNFILSLLFLLAGYLSHYTYAGLGCSSVVNQMPSMDEDLGSVPNNSSQNLRQDITYQV